MELYLHMEQAFDAFIKKEKTLISKYFVLLQRPLTSKNLLLDRSDSVTPAVAAMTAVCVAKVMAHGRSLFSFEAKTLANGDAFNSSGDHDLFFHFVLTAVFPPAILIFS